MNVYTTRPYNKIIGLHTAVVVGPEGEVVYTDDYGRVKIKLHWDNNPDESIDGACWARVLQPLNGANWGSQWIPRAGQEVLVRFIEGDGRRPIVVGSVYNGKHPPAYSYPEQAGISSIRTHVEDTSEPVRYHELSFDDNPQTEKLYLRAERQLREEVQHSSREYVKGNAELDVAHQITMNVEKGEAFFSAKSIELTVQGNQVMINEEGISVKPAQGTVQLLSQGGGGLRPVARVGDTHDCPDMTDLIPHEGIVNIAGIVLNILYMRLVITGRHRMQRVVKN